MRKFRNRFVLMLMFTLLFAFPLTAEEAEVTPSTDGDKAAETVEKSDEKKDATEKKDETPEKSDKEDKESTSKDEDKSEPKEDEAKAESKDEVEAEPKEEAKAESKEEVEAEPKPEVKPAVVATPPVVAPAEVAAPTADLKSAASTEKDADADKDEKKEEKPKRFSVFINNAFMNTQDSARPVFRYALSGGFGVRLPWKIGFKFSLGLYTRVAYNRPQSGSNSSGRTGYDTLLNKNLTAAAFDGTPMVFALNRPFQLPWKLTLVPFVKSTLSATSKYLWEMEIYSKLFLGMSLSRSFELKKNLSLSTSVTTIYNVTFNGKEWIGETAPMKIGRNPQSLIYSANTGLNYKDFNFGITWTQAFVYLRNGSWEADQNPEFPTNEGVDRVKWQTINSLQVDASYSIKGFNFGLFVVTEGPWTLYYTGPSWYPFRADMTTYGFTLGYNYSF
ncbi:hypothetical protein KAH37_00220 [bacterium]|nr:hypothetical protein [bacterium]